MILLAALQTTEGAIVTGSSRSLLRHRRLQTTAVYARVDRDRLKTLVLAWPEVRSVRALCDLEVFRDQF